MESMDISKDDLLEGQEEKKEEPSSSSDTREETENVSNPVEEITTIEETQSQEDVEMTTSDEINCTEEIVNTVEISETKEPDTSEEKETKVEPIIEEAEEKVSEEVVKEEPEEVNKSEERNTSDEASDTNDEENAEAVAIYEPDPEDTIPDSPNEDPEYLELLDLVDQVEDYIPTVPDALSLRYLQEAGFSNVEPRIVRLMSIASQKFISEIANDALQHCKTRTINSQHSSGHSSNKDKKPNKDRKYTLTVEDLQPALAENGITVRKPQYFV